MYCIHSRRETPSFPVETARSGARGGEVVVRRSRIGFALLPWLHTIGRAAHRPQPPVPAAAAPGPAAAAGRRHRSKQVPFFCCCFASLLCVFCFLHAPTFPPFFAASVHPWHERHTSSVHAACPPPLPPSSSESSPPPSPLLLLLLLGRVAKRSTVNWMALAAGLLRK